jgi:hypothetical protein
MVVLFSLACAVSCVSGSADDAGANGPECYTNADCTPGHECSGGICVGFSGCDSSCNGGCRNNEDCLDCVCRIKCTALSDCEDQGLLCGGDTAHCKPKPNPTRSQTQTQSGTGGTASGSGGSGNGAAGHPPGTAGTPGGAGTPGSAGSPATSTAGRAG